MEIEIEPKLPFIAWGTKGFEFWALLSLVLKEAQPAAILELGCGRSSTFFADYAYAHDASFVGIENDRRWFNKTALDIDLLGFGQQPLRHVELDSNTNWYDLDGFESATSKPGHFDFVFIDGPNEKQAFSNEMEVAKYFQPEDRNLFGHRDNSTGLAAIKSVTGDCTVMMVDDVHNHHVLKSVDLMLSEPASYEKYYFLYKPHPSTTNAMCICIKRDSPLVRRLPAIQDMLGLKLVRDYIAPAARQDKKSWWRRNP